MAVAYNNVPRENYFREVSSLISHDKECQATYPWKANCLIHCFEEIFQLFRSKVHIRKLSLDHFFIFLKRKETLRFITQL